MYLKKGICYVVVTAVLLSTCNVAEAGAMEESMVIEEETLTTVSQEQTSMEQANERQSEEQSGEYQTEEKTTEEETEEMTTEEEIYTLGNIEIFEWFGDKVNTLGERTSKDYSKKLLEIYNAYIILDDIEKEIVDSSYNVKGLLENARQENHTNDEYGISISGENLPWYWRLEVTTQDGLEDELYQEYLDYCESQREQYNDEYDDDYNDDYDEYDNDYEDDYDEYDDDYEEYDDEYYDDEYTDMYGEDVSLYDVINNECGMLWAYNIAIYDTVEEKYIEQSEESIQIEFKMGPDDDIYYGGNIDIITKTSDDTVYVEEGYTSEEDKSIIYNATNFGKMGAFYSVNNCYPVGSDISVTDYDPKSKTDSVSPKTGYSYYNLVVIMIASLGVALFSEKKRRNCK